MRKAYMVKLPLTAPNTSEPPNVKNAKKGDCDCGSHEIEIGEERNFLKHYKLVMLMILLMAQHLLTSVPLPTSDPASKPTH